ncbi:MAG TPA: hypothetical protein VIU33_03790 [Nitrospiria bacterium]
MLQLLEKHKGYFQLFSLLPLGHMAGMLLAGEMYRKKYPREAFEQLIQEPLVTFLGLGIAAVGFFTWILLMVHAYKNGGFTTPLKVIWIANLVLFGVFAMPVYFFRFILNPLSENQLKNEVVQALLWTGIFFVTSGMVFLYQVQVLAPYLLEAPIEGGVDI